MQLTMNILMIDLYCHNGTCFASILVAQHNYIRMYFIHFQEIADHHLNG